MITRFLVLAPLIICTPPGLKGEVAGHNCDMWGFIAGGEGGEMVSEEIEYQLFEGPPSTLKSLGSGGNIDGWGLGFFDEWSEEPVILRGPLPAFDDPLFDLAATELAYPPPYYAVAHVRNATSGCIPETGNPHPFLRYHGGDYYLLAHNGGISQSILRDLIGEEYLNENPPLTCPENPVDSELYLIFVLKRISEYCGDVERGIIEAVIDLSAAIPGEGEYLNFLMTDGNRFWALHFKSRLSGGYRLFHYPSEMGHFVATAYLNYREDLWEEIPNFSLFTFKGDASPIAREFFDYFSLFLDADSDGDFCDPDTAVSASDLLLYRIGFIDMEEREAAEEASIEIRVTGGLVLKGATPLPDEIIETGKKDRSGGSLGMILRWRLDKGEFSRRIELEATANCPEGGEIEVTAALKRTGEEVLEETVRTQCSPDEGGEGGSASPSSLRGCASCHSATARIRWGPLTSLPLLLTALFILFRPVKGRGF